MRGSLRPRAARRRQRRGQASAHGAQRIRRAHRARSVALDAPQKRARELAAAARAIGWWWSSQDRAGSRRCTARKRLATRLMSRRASRAGAGVALTRAGAGADRGAHQSGACTARCARPHHRDRRGPRRRRSGRHRQERHARKGRDARHRARARAAAGFRTGHEGRVDPRRRLFRAAARPHAARARAPGGPVCLDSRRFDPRPQRRRLLGLHPLAAWRHHRGGALARGGPERGGSDRRRVAREQGRYARLGAARPVADGIAHREPHRCRARAAATQSGGRGEKAAGAAGGLHGAEIARYSLDADRDGLHLQPGGRAAPAQHRASGEACRRHPPGIARATSIPILLRARALR